MNKNQKIILLIGLFLISLIGVLSISPIPQDLEYHKFADQRGWLGISNFNDVISNIPYAIVGIIGTFLTFRQKNNIIEKSEFLAFLCAFAGIFLVSLGSAYYHFAPNNHSLVFDRLPMTIGFMAIFSLIIAERIDTKAGIILLPILILAGFFSIFYWDYTESVNRGDLRFYALVQFFPIVAMPIVLRLFTAKYTGTYYLVEMIIFYVIAKLLEHFDAEIFSLTSNIISGHSLKHISSALACYSLVRYLKYKKIRA